MHVFALQVLVARSWNVIASSWSSGLLSSVAVWYNSALSQNSLQWKKGFQELKRALEQIPGIWHLLFTHLKKKKKGQGKAVIQLKNLLQNNFVKTVLGLPSYLYVSSNMPFRSCRTCLCEVLPDFNFHWLFPFISNSRLPLHFKIWSVDVVQIRTVC